MAFADKQNAFRYINDYQKEKYDRITILVKKGEKDRIKSVASDRGMSVSEFVAYCINKEVK